MENETIYGSADVSKADVKSSAHAHDMPTGVEIQGDIDNIIVNLENLISNLESGKDSVDMSNESLSESAQSLISADLAMIPLIAAGGIAGGTALLFKKIGELVKKKKVRKKYAAVDKIKTQVATMELSISNANTKIEKIEDPEAKSKARKQIEDTRENMENLELRAKEIDEALNDVLPNDSEYLAVLRAETKIKVAKIMSMLPSISDSKKKEIESSVKSAESTINRVEQESNDRTEEYNQKDQQTPTKQKIENLENRRDDLKKRREESSEEEQETLDDLIKDIDEKIKKLKEVKDTEKTADDGKDVEDDKSKEPATDDVEDEKDKDDKTSAKESFRLEDTKYIYESRPQYISEKFRRLLS